MHRKPDATSPPKEGKTSDWSPLPSFTSHRAHRTHSFSPIHLATAPHLSAICPIFGLLKALESRFLRRGGLGGGQGSLHTGEGLLGPRRPLGTGRGPLNSDLSAAGANSVTGQGGIGARPPIANQKSCQQRPGPRWHSMKLANGGQAAAGMQFFGASWERLGRHFGSSSCWAEGGVHRTGFVECISVLSFYNQKHPH